MEWSAQQEKALGAVADWITEKRGPQVFRLFGYAGTGKTTLARHIAENVEGEVQFGAYTGKAALVLRSKGCGEARTIHSMIYRPKDMDSEEPSFVLNEDSPASKASLIVIDECSMVDEDLGRDLLSFGKKVLVLGDPAQLPPVKGGGFFTEHEPDCMLTDVHRQAADNPIVRLSMQVRAGERLSIGDHGAMRVIPRAAIDTETVKTPIRCWSGSTRPAAPITSGCANYSASRRPCRKSAKNWSAFATTRPRACSTARSSR